MRRCPGKFAFILTLNAALIGAPSLIAQASPGQSVPQSAPAPAPGKMTLSQAPPDQPPASLQPAGPPPPFEVATIKATKANEQNSMLMFTPDGISVTGFKLGTLIREAFNTEDDHIIGLPEWAKSSRFDIEAKVAPDDAPKLKNMKFPERKTMVVQLLVERLGLKYHRETRELPVYELVIAKGGVKMQPAKEQDPANTRHMLMFSGPGQMESTAMKTENLAHILSTQLSRTVLDKTGLTGNYDFTLKWTPDPSEPAMGPPGGPPDASPDANNSGGPTLFTALEEQLGLKLVSAKGPEEVIVIDHIEQPSAN